MCLPAGSWLEFTKPVARTSCPSFLPGICIGGGGARGSYEGRSIDNAEEDTATEWRPVEEAVTRWSHDSVTSLGGAYPNSVASPLRVPSPGHLKKTSAVLSKVREYNILPGAFDDVKELADP
jgi:hypothetical protein